MSLAHRRMVLVGVFVVLLLVVAALLVSAPPGVRTGGLSSTASVLLSGAAGGVLVFALTTTAGWVVRTRQRGRELRGLSRVLWPEMKRNWLAVGALKHWRLGRNMTKDDFPTREAWLDTRNRLSQLMREADF